MPSFRSDRTASLLDRNMKESRDIAQLGIDFVSAYGYSAIPQKGEKTMNHELFESLDRKINELLEKYAALKDENSRLVEENQRFQAEREGIRQRVDVILGKLEGV